MSYNKEKDMAKVKGLIWDEWNKKHIAKHNLLPEEIEEVCHGRFSRKL